MKMTTWRLLEPTAEGPAHLAERPPQGKESLLPNCMDLVVWGHEHECKIEGGMNAVVESADVRGPHPPALTTRPQGHAPPLAR